jgi:hypothetical protein
MNFPSRPASRTFLPLLAVSRRKIGWQKFDDHCHRCQHLPDEVGIMNEPTNTTDQSQNHEESAYSLLIRSEEKSRNAFEILIYPLLVLGVVIAIWQFALQAMDLPSKETKAAPYVASISGFHSRS